MGAPPLTAPVNGIINPLTDFGKTPSLPFREIHHNIDFTDAAGRIQSRCEKKNRSILPNQAK